MENETMETRDEGMKKGGMVRKLKSRKLIVTVMVLLALVIVVVFGKSYFVVASVDGSYISRASVVRELEKKSGKQLLDVLITQRLITNEARKQKIELSDEELNARVKSIEENVTKQGGKLTDLLAAQGLTEKTFRDQITLEMKLEKLIADKVLVTDEEVDVYVKENKVPLPKGKEVETKAQIKEELKGAKLNEEAGKFVTSLREAAKIKYYVEY